MTPTLPKIEAALERLGPSLANSCCNITTHEQQEEWLADFTTLRAAITERDTALRLACATLCSTVHQGDARYGWSAEE